jgi:uncharacterized protein (DUF2164 family)
MTIELSEQKRKDAIASIQQYFLKNMPEEIGALPASLLLNFFLQEIGPAVYNKAVTDAQERLHARIGELDSELYVDEFQYWNIKKKSKAKNS